MSLKTKPYWLKGGIYTLFVLLFLSIIAFGSINFFALVLFPALIIDLLFHIRNNRLVFLISIFIITPIIYFLIGSIIGLIIEKAKAK